MSTSFYMVKTCDLGCEHRVHLGQYGGGGKMLLRGYRQPAEWECLPCGVPFAVVSFGDTKTLIAHLVDQGWTMDTNNAPCTPEEFVSWTERAQSGKSRLARRGRWEWVDAEGFEFCETEFS